MIYFVSDSAGAVKIGLVSSLDRMRLRLTEFRIGSPHRLTVGALIDGGLAEERALHRRWLAHRVRGEWFAGIDVPATTYDVGYLDRADRSLPMADLGEATSGVIYFVRCDVTGLTKIGWARGGLGASRSTGGVWARLRSFRTSCSTPLRVVSVVDGSPADERRLHREHADRRDHGEWFRDVEPPPTAYPLDGFRDDVGTTPLPTVDPAAMMKACVECGATFREKTLTRPRARCKPCRGWYALALAASGAARRAERPASDAELVQRQRAGRERNAALEAEWRPRVEASGGTWALFCARVGRGESPAASLGPKRRAGKKPGGSGKRTGVTERARAISADIGLNWHSVYRVLAGIAANHRRAGDILAHPLARAA